MESNLCWNYDCYVTIPQEVSFPRGGRYNHRQFQIRENEDLPDFPDSILSHPFYMLYIYSFNRNVKTLITLLAKKFVKLEILRLKKNINIHVSLNNEKETLFHGFQCKIIIYLISFSFTIVTFFLLFLIFFDNIISLWKRIIRYIYRGKKSSFILHPPVPVYSSKLITIFNVKLKVQRHNRGIGVAQHKRILLLKPPLSQLSLSPQEKPFV